MDRGFHGGLITTTYRPDTSPEQDLPPNFPSPQSFFLLIDAIWKAEKFLRLVEWNGARYVLLFEFNKELERCAENDCLKRVHEARGEDVYCLRKARFECMKLFFPALEKWYASGGEGGDEERKSSGHGRAREIKIQMKTVDGVLKDFDHDEFIDVCGGPVPNPIPSARVFSRKEIKIVQKVHQHLARVMVGEEEYFMKSMAWKNEAAGLLEMTRIHRGGWHPNVVTVVGVVGVPGSDGINGFLMPYIDGCPLHKVKGVTVSQRELLKKGIMDAVESLHSRGVVWGDVKPQNVVVEKNTGKPFLIDFEGVYTPPWVTSDVEGTTGGDRQGAKRILEFIDNIPEQK